MKHKVSDNVRCPFYKCEERQAIYCEGVEEGTALHLGFSIPARLNDYKTRFCENDYPKCRIARMLDEKYS